MKKYNELIKKCGFTLILLLIFYFGQSVPVPGYVANLRIPAENFSLEKMLAITSGGLFSSPTLLSLGMGPFMTVSILISVCLFADRDLAAQISKETRGRMEIVGVFIVALLQSVPLAFSVRNTVIPKMDFLSPLEILLFTMLCFVVGALLISWLASLNIIYGLGGPFVLILPGIMRGVTRSLVADYSSVIVHFWRLIILVIFTILFIGISVAVYFAEYRFNVQRIGIDKHSKEAYIAFRILIAGSMPLMFATTFMYFPAYLMQLFNFQNQTILELFNVNKLSGILIYALILYLLGVLLSFINIMPDDIAKDLKESGDYIVGVTPGWETKRYITKRVWLFSLVGSLFLPIIVTVPLIIGVLTGYSSITNLSNYFAMLFVLVSIYDNLQQDVRFLLYKDNYELFGTNRRGFE